MKLIHVLFLIFIMSSAVCNAQEITTKRKFLKTKTYHGDERISYKELKSILNAYPESSPYIKSASKDFRKMEILTYIGVGFLGWYIYEISKKSNQNKTIPEIASVSASLIGLYFGLRANGKYRTAINLYNSRNLETSINIVPTITGVNFQIIF